MSDEEYEVEKVLDHKRKKPKNGMRRHEHYYFVKWLGYPDSSNSWCDFKEMSCHRLVQEFWDAKEKNCPHPLNLSEGEDEVQDINPQIPMDYDEDVAQQSRDDNASPLDGDSRESSPFPELFPKGVPLHPLVAPATRFYPYRTIDGIITKHKRAFDERSIIGGHYVRNMVLMKRNTKPIDEMTEEELEADIKFFEEREEEEKKIWFPACEAEIATLNGFERGADLKEFVRLEVEVDEKSSEEIYYAILKFLDKGQLVEEKIDIDYLKCNCQEVISDYLDRAAKKAREKKYAEYGIDNFEAWKSERIAQGKKLC